MDFDVLDLVVPFRGDWHPVAVAWMFLHKLSLPAWIFATIHLLAAGADAKNSALMAVLAGSLAIVSLLMVLRLLDYRSAQRRARSAAKAMRAMRAGGSVLESAPQATIDVGFEW